MLIYYMVSKNYIREYQATCPVRIVSTMHKQQSDVKQKEFEVEGKDQIELIIKNIKNGTEGFNLHWPQ